MNDTKIDHIVHKAGSNICIVEVFLANEIIRMIRNTP